MKEKVPLILAIDTSCDETAAAVTAGLQVLGNVVWSQVDVHRRWGGVVPDLARAEHRKHLNKVINLALKNAHTTCKRLRLPWQVSRTTIDAIAVTQGPGLAIALEVGIKKAKSLAQKYQKPLIAINHMEGHLLSAFAQNAKGKGVFPPGYPKFPALGLLVSGGHTQLVLVKKVGDYQLLGQTLDDAAGEAFDKVARMLNLGYPGGPLIERLAKEGNPDRFDLPVPMAKKPGLNFSFSGLKTACFYRLQKIPPGEKNHQFYCDFAASFQKVLTESILIRLKRAINLYHPKMLLLGGGVISNLYLRAKVRFLAKKFGVPVFFPYSRRLLTDNAAMIGVAAFFKYQVRQFITPRLLDRKPNFPLSSTFLARGQQLKPEE